MNALNERIKDIRIPAFMKDRPVSKRGYLIPWFVEWLKDGMPCPPGVGEPDFRIMRPRAIVEAHVNGLCWVCGNRRIAGTQAFVLGPMCAVNRISAEPPSHYNCAQYAVRACPFLTQPRMVRNEKNVHPDKIEVDGMIRRNPGVALLWVTREYVVHKVTNGVLFGIGEPTRLEWWREGRTATRAEVEESIESGLPELMKQAEAQGLADRVPAMIEKARRLMPHA